jgi:hypothetical protein
MVLASASVLAGSPVVVSMIVRPRLSVVPAARTTSPTSRWLGRLNNTLEHPENTSCAACATSPPRSRRAPAALVLDVPADDALTGSDEPIRQRAAHEP